LFNSYQFLEFENFTSKLESQPLIGNKARSIDMLFRMVRVLSEN